jgi:phospholipase D3/4
MPFGDGSHMILSAAPRELCVGNRTFDEDILVKTIREAEKSVCVCVMDLAPVSLYRGEYNADTHMYMDGDDPASPVWWPALFDALVYAVTTKCVRASLFVSKWAHSSDFLTPYLRALKATTDAAAAKHSMRTGTLEVKRFVIPGWDATELRSSKGNFGTGTEPRAYPGHTRVNHTKYIVTDKRINIGTSNMTWDYFTGTAGASFNTDDPDLVAKLQEIFDRDWTSSYALPLV